MSSQVSHTFEGQQKQNCQSVSNQPQSQGNKWEYIQESKKSVKEIQAQLCKQFQTMKLSTPNKTQRNVILEQEFLIVSDEDQQNTEKKHLGIDISVGDHQTFLNSNRKSEKNGINKRNTNYDKLSPSGSPEKQEYNLHQNSDQKDQNFNTQVESEPTPQITQENEAEEELDLNQSSQNEFQRVVSDIHLKKSIIQFESQKLKQQIMKLKQQIQQKEVQIQQHSELKEIHFQLLDQQESVINQLNQQIVNREINEEKILLEAEISFLLSQINSTKERIDQVKLQARQKQQGKKIKSKNFLCQQIQNQVDFIKNQIEHKDKYLKEYQEIKNQKLEDLRSQLTILRGQINLVDVNSQKDNKKLQKLTFEMKNFIQNSDNFKYRKIDYESELKKHFKNQLIHQIKKEQISKNIPVRQFALF